MAGRGRGNTRTYSGPIEDTAIDAFAIMVSRGVRPEIAAQALGIPHSDVEIDLLLEEPHVQARIQEGYDIINPKKKRRRKAT